MKIKHVLVTTIRCRTKIPFSFVKKYVKIEMSEKFKTVKRSCLDRFILIGLHFEGVWTSGSQWIKNDGSGFLNPSTNRMLTRIKSIYLYILENGTVTTRELAEEFGSTPRTIQRDLNVLEYNELISSPKRGKWTTTEKKVKLG